MLWHGERSLYSLYQKDEVNGAEKTGGKEGWSSSERRRAAVLSGFICLFLFLSIYLYSWVKICLIHTFWFCVKWWEVSVCVYAYITECVMWWSWGKKKKNPLLASEFSVVTLLPITLSSLSACVYVCVRVCVHTAPGVQWWEQTPALSLSAGENIFITEACQAWRHPDCYCQPASRLPFVSLLQWKFSALKPPNKKKFALCISWKGINRNRF